MIGELLISRQFAARFFILLFPSESTTMCCVRKGTYQPDRYGSALGRHAQRGGHTARPRDAWELSSDRELFAPEDAEREGEGSEQAECAIVKRALLQEQIQHFDLLVLAPARYGTPATPQDPHSLFAETLDLLSQSHLVAVVQTAPFLTDLRSCLTSLTRLRA